MIRQADFTRQHDMDLRRVLKFNGSLGLTLPIKFARSVGLHWKDYVELYFIDPDKIVIKKHKESENSDMKYE